MSTGRSNALRDGNIRARDLGSVELWERSLARSRQRRRLFALNRRNRRRRKSVSVAMAASLAGGPVFPQAVAAATGGSGSPLAGADATSVGLDNVGSAKVVLEVGSQGALVAAAQRRLNEVLPLSHLALDGIYGPLTRSAVVDFQRRHAFLADGKIDARTWAKLFDAPVLVFGATDTAGSATGGAATASVPAPRAHSQFVSLTHPSGAPRTVHPRADASGTSAPAGSAQPSAGAVDGGAASSTSGGSVLAGGPGGVSTSPPASGGGASGGGTTISVVAPTAPSTQPSTYVLTDGVALPLPRQYLTGGYVDQGVDYAAPGGTPEYAMGDGVIIGEGISGFGPSAPILKITSGPLAGLEVYYGHSASDLVHVGDRVTAGQQITAIGYGIVGLSTGPHLEIGLYPPGGMGAGSKMLSVINALLRQHPSGRAWGSTGVTTAVSAQVVKASRDRSRSSRTSGTTTQRTSTTGGVATQPQTASSGSQAAAPSSGSQPAPNASASSSDTSSQPAAVAPAAVSPAPSTSSTSSTPSAPAPASTGAEPPSSLTSTAATSSSATTTSTTAPAPAPSPASATDPAVSAAPTSAADSTPPAAPPTSGTALASQSTTPAATPTAPSVAAAPATTPAAPAPTDTTAETPMPSSAQ